MPRQGKWQFGNSGREQAMIIVTGQVRFADGEIQRLTPAFRMNIQATRAEAGCARYAYAVDIADPNLAPAMVRRVAACYDEGAAGCFLAPGPAKNLGWAVNVIGPAKAGHYVWVIGPAAFDFAQARKAGHYV